MSKEQPGNQEKAWRFSGFVMPTTTPVPDQLFDELLYQLEPSEMMVLLYIVRRTYGFKKVSDNISLKQLVEGITTRDGRVLDRGTGLGKSTVARALNGLEEKGVIVRERRRSAERGNEPTAYHLNIPGFAPAAPVPGERPLSQNETPPLSQNDTSLVPRTGQALVPNRDTQQTVKQETVRQQHGGVLRQEKPDSSTSRSKSGERPLTVATAGLAQALHDFGLSPDAAAELTATYPEEHIMAKLDFVRWLQTEHPTQVRSNPAGFLRRAIERDYAPPPTYQTPAQRAAAEKARAETTATEERQLRAAEEQYRAAKEQSEHRLRELCPSQPVAGSDLTTQELWAAVQTTLQEQLTAPNYHMWVHPTMLVTCDQTTAVVAASSEYHREHLADRLDRAICQALGAALGRTIRCEYITPQVLPMVESAPTTEGTARRRRRQGSVGAAS